MTGSRFNYCNTLASQKAGASASFSLVSHPYIAHTNIHLQRVSLAYLPPSPEPFDFAAFNALFRPHVGYDIIDYFAFFSSEEAPALLTETVALRSLL